MRKRDADHTLFTIGHSTRSVKDFLSTLHAFSVTRVVDIRSFPRSRTNPQFNIEAIAKTLSEAAIGYVHLPELGGRRAKSTLIEDEVDAGWERRPFHSKRKTPHLDAESRPVVS